MSEPRKIRILVVDDHPFLREGIVGAVNSQSDMVLIGEASNGQEAIEKFRLLRPDVTLMDLQMPTMGGTDAITAIRDEFPGARIVVLTAYKGDIQALRAFKAGAVGYLLKNMLRKELLDTIRIVDSGKRRIPPEIARELGEHIVDDQLSDREVDVLRLIATGTSNKIIATQTLAGGDYRKDARAEHSAQAGCKRPDTRRNDRLETRLYRTRISVSLTGKERGRTLLFQIGETLLTKPVELPQGTLEMLILKAVSLGPLHGYGILLRIQQISGERLEILQGSFYTAIYRLEGQGWIKGEWGQSENNRRARFYSLTAAGTRQLKAETAKWTDMASVVAGILAKRADEI